MRCHLKSFHMEDTESSITGRDFQLLNKWYGCWYHEDDKSQNISIHNIDQVSLEYFGPSVGRHTSIYWELTLQFN